MKILLEITIKSQVAREIVRDLWKDNYLYILFFAAVILIIIYQIIVNAVKVKQLLANQEEANRLLRKIAGEPEDKNEENEEIN